VAKLTKRIVDTAEPRSKHERIEICQWGVVRLLIRAVSIKARLDAIGHTPKLARPD
jgi:hypothetical protein